MKRFLLVLVVLLIAATVSTIYVMVKKAEQPTPARKTSATISTKVSEEASESELDSARSVSVSSGGVSQRDTLDVVPLPKKTEPQTIAATTGSVPKPTVLSQPKTAVEKTREDTLVIMARQESKDERLARQSQQQPVEEYNQPTEPAVQTTAPTKHIVREVILGQGQDTLWTDERPSPWRRVTRSAPAGSGVSISYRYSYGDRPVKRVEYIVTADGWQQILSQELIQAMLEQYRSNMVGVSPKETKQVDFIINLDLSSGRAALSSVTNGAFAQVGEVDWADPEKVKVMEYTLRDHNPDLAGFLEQVNLEVAALGARIPFVQLVIHVIRLGQTVPNMVIRTWQGIPSWAKPAGVFYLSRKFKRFWWNFENEPNITSELGVFWTTEWLMPSFHFCDAVGVNPIQLGLSINNRDHLSFVFDGMVIEAHIYNFQVQFTWLGVTIEPSTNIKTFTALGCFSQTIGGSDSFHLPRLAYLW